MNLNKLPFLVRGHCPDSNHLIKSVNVYLTNMAFLFVRAESR